MKRSKGFTLVELLVVIGIIATLLTILVPTLTRALELARRQQCVGNLKVIASGVAQYSSDFGHCFPVESPSVSGVGTIGGPNRVKGGKPITLTGFSDGEASSAGTSRALYLLVLTKYASTTAFVCPSVSDGKVDKLPPSTSRYYDFEGPQGLSYSYQVFKNGTDGVLKYRFDTMCNPSVVYLADRNPINGPDGWTGNAAAGWTADGWTKDSGGTDTVRAGQDEWNRNSYNHFQLGQNVVTIDSSIRFAETPFCGAVDTSVTPNVYDNIWTQTFGVLIKPGSDPTAALPDDSAKKNEGLDSLLVP